MRANEGRSNAATRVLSRLNERFGLFDANGQRNPNVPNRLKHLLTLPGPKFTLRPGETEPLMPMLQAENDWLRDTFGAEFHDPRLQFEDSRIEWTEESLRQLAEGLAVLPPEAREYLMQGLEGLDVPESARAGLAVA